MQRVTLIITIAFLIIVAGGLVLSSLRPTADPKLEQHETDVMVEELSEADTAENGNETAVASNTPQTTIQQQTSQTDTARQSTAVSQQPQPKQNAPTPATTGTTVSDDEDETQDADDDDESTPAQSATPASSNDEPAVPEPVPAPAASSNITWGAFVGYSAGDLADFEQMVGEPVDMRAVFVNWDDPFPASFGSNLRSSGKTLVIFWEQYGISIDSITAGDSDAYIKRFADDAREYGGDVILAPLHEMNGDWDPWDGPVGSNSPSKVVATWRHIVDTFGNVPNAKFAWAVNNESVPDTQQNAIANYYPGDAYVDYVAVDGFNFGSPWQTFDQIFSSALSQVEGYGKPIYILSTASAAGPKKATWITDAFGVQVYEHPEIAGWVWFNENKEEDWRVNSSGASLDAFRSIVPH